MTTWDGLPLMPKLRNEMPRMPEFRNDITGWDATGLSSPTVSHWRLLKRAVRFTILAPEIV
eukprot:4085103-Amphidinium_carterae.1